ncbi:TcpH [Clostridium perfringens]|uniref:Putative pore-forming membrane protein n=2 Tax=Clostridium perfringens TaxID=1502 RepID=A0A4Y5T4V1_CLOPF|nr:TcpH [Clostridium perfringens]EHA1006751.1 TcpH [Clostridium perfringens]EHA1009669.1 TcpH [Clostridium perfringens]EHA1021737.1 TcpH [Clostridium perfringens]MBO3326967.1 TcpH [Clostridium perfringens]QDB01284.1 putative pore-forming membrane protein [Clostridium perfringens]
MENVKINIYSKFLYLKNKLTYKNILKAIVIIATIVIAYNCLTKIAYADGFLSYGNSDDPYKSIPEGWGMFISEKYRNNYALDIIDTHGWELIDKAIIGLTNIVFSGIVMISWFGVNIFRFCFTNDIAAGFANQLNSVLGSLNNGIFNNFFMIVFMISLFSIVYNLYKKNFSAIGSQILAVAIIYATTAFLSNGAVGFLSKTTEFSKTIGTSAIVAINGKENNEGSLEDYSKTVVGTLWGNFVQQPWVMLEFDGKVPLISKDNTEAIADKNAMEYSKEILSEPYGSDKREKALESINEKFNKELFSKNGINTKLVSVCVLFIITLIKMVILIAVGMIQIGFQLMSILLILLLPFIMLIAIVPFFGGTNIIKGIARKYLGTQLGIIVSSFVLALLVLVDTVTLTMFQSWGANLIIALLMQCTCWIMVIAFRKQLMNGLINLQNRIAPGTAGAFKFGAKPLDKGADIAKEYAVNPAMDRAYDIGDNLITKAQYAKEYTKGNLSLYKDRKVAQAIDFLGSKYDNLKNNKPEDIENSNNPKENIDKVNDTKNKVNSNENINKKPVEKFDLNGVKATKPSNITSENIPNKNINGENKPNIDEEAVTKNDIKDPIENKDIAPKTIDENIKNNGNDTGTIQDKSPGSKEKTISEDEEITTKPEEIKTPEKTINKENLNELKNENTSADRKNNYSNSSNTSVTEVPEDLVEEKSVEAINKAKNDVKANKEKMNNNISSKNTEINPEAKENIEVASSPEVTEIKKKSTKKVENIKNNGQPKEKSPDKKQIKEVSTKERVERVKSFMGVSKKDIKSKEKHLENKLEYIKKGNSKNFKKKGS